MMHGFHPILEEQIWQGLPAADEDEDPHARGDPSLHAEILRLSPQAAWWERVNSQLPVSLEKIMEPSSPAVLLELSKEQDLDGFEEGRDPSVQWKLPAEEPESSNTLRFCLSLTEKMT
ncbi:ABC-type organic anion transporter ABCA8-like [Camelus dromedarius]|uniref:ABC-type organic anion transporter ABCA8-like n=1 Tax=Camelus dromedarius TaxID=9838 RepID=UPI00311A0065